MTVAQPLRVLHLLAAPFPTLQGSQVYVGGMVRALASRGHDVSLLCYGHGADGAGDGFDGVRIRRAPRIPGYGRLRAGPDLVKPCLDLLLAGRACALARGVDVVHAHNYEAPLAGYLARLLRGVPVVYHGHNIMEEELPTYYAGPSLQRIARGVGRLLDRQIPRRAELALAISEPGLRALRRLGCRNVRLLPPAVDLMELEGARPERAQVRHGLHGRSWVVYAGNMDAYQDLDLLLAALARVPDAGLLLATANPLEGVGQRCDRFGIGPERRRLVRVRSWAESRDLISAASVAASPRTACAGFSIKLLNYLGLGLPTVVSAGSAVPIDGLVATHDGDPGGMAAAISYLLAHPEQRSGLGALARTAVRSHWGWCRRVVELEEVYRDLLSRGPDNAVLPV